MLGTLILEGGRALVGAVSGHFKRKGEIKQAKHNAELTRLGKQQDADNQWNAAMANATATSWKDEYWTVLLSIPLVMLFIPLPDVQQIAIDGFNALAGTPEWYRWALGTAIAAAFAVKSIIPRIGKGA